MPCHHIPAVSCPECRDGRAQEPVIGIGAGSTMPLAYGESDADQVTAARKILAGTPWDRVSLANSFVSLLNTIALREQEARSAVTRLDDVARELADLRQDSVLARNHLRDTPYNKINLSESVRSIFDELDRQQKAAAALSEELAEQRSETSAAMTRCATAEKRLCESVRREARDKHARRVVELCIQIMTYALAEIGTMEGEP